MSPTQFIKALVFGGLVLVITSCSPNLSEIPPAATATATQTPVPPTATLTMTPEDTPTATATPTETEDPSAVAASLNLDMTRSYMISGNQLLDAGLPMAVKENGVWRVTNDEERYGKILDGAKKPFIARTGTSDGIVGGVEILTLAPCYTGRYRVVGKDIEVEMVTKNNDQIYKMWVSLGATEYPGFEEATRVIYHVGGGQMQLKPAELADVSSWIDPGQQVVMDFWINHPGNLPIERCNTATGYCTSYYRYLYKSVFVPNKVVINSFAQAILEGTVFEGQPVIPGEHVAIYR